MTLLRRCLVVCAAALALLTGLPVSVDAAVVVTVDKSTQRMSVAVDGAPRYNWAVSTGRAGYGTPNGTYAPTRLERSWFSRQYYNSPMPHSIFFHGGYAIHGSYEISRLGGPASHGCIRLHPSNAATLFRLVNQHGAGGTRIIVTGSSSGVTRKQPP
ncbi:MAG: L,D-transpeptidase, partial [Blastochloris sp.]|nr:L,D-transpeptidase [Blastochloris sp.]